MNNSHRKKLIKRLTKSPVKEFPLANLYILVLILLGVFVELADSWWLRWFYRLFSLGLMAYYIHQKASALDYLTCNLAQIALIFSIGRELLVLYGEKETEIIERTVSVIGLLLYAVGFSMKQPISKVSLWMKVFLGVSCSAIILVQGTLTYWLWDSPERNLVVRSVVTLLMVLAIFRYGNTSPRSFLFFCISAGAFVVAESITSLLKHLKYESVLSGVLQGPIVLMGHYLIMHGSILHCNLQDAIDKIKNRSNWPADILCKA